MLPPERELMGKALPSLKILEGLAKLSIGSPHTMVVIFYQTRPREGKRDLEKPTVIWPPYK